MRYFIEVAYVGTYYAGSQIQRNAVSIQALLEEKLTTVLRASVSLTGASRTDAGVHARQNFYHFDSLSELDLFVLKKSLNALLPQDIAVRNIVRVQDDAHCRYSAIKRYYTYHIIQEKNPFLHQRAYYFPVALDKQLIDDLALFILNQIDFTSFSKKNTQVNEFSCRIFSCYWEQKEEKYFLFHIGANRFLRGMVRALVATQLQVATRKTNMSFFDSLFRNPKIASAFFSAPAEGLYLMGIEYPKEIWNDNIPNLNKKIPE